MLSVCYFLSSYHIDLNSLEMINILKLTNLHRDKSIKKYAWALLVITNGNSAQSAEMYSKANNTRDV